jgi:transposase
MQEAEASDSPDASCAATGAWTLAIVKRTDAHRFVVQPKRWVVERAKISLSPRSRRSFASPDATAGTYAWRRRQSAPAQSLFDYR